MDPHQSARAAKFAADELIKTAVSAAGAQSGARRITTPMGTAQSEPSASTPSVDPRRRSRLLTREVPPGMLEQLAANGSVEVRVTGSGRRAAHAGLGGDAQAARRSRSAAHPGARARLGARRQLSRAAPPAAGARRSARHRGHQRPAARRARPPAPSTWRWRSASAGARACCWSRPTCARRRWRRCSASCRPSASRRR